MSTYQEWANKNGYSRPFQALLKMTPDDREAIRIELNFEWKIRERTDPEIEAKEIIDCDIKGVVARLHTQLEMLNPFSKNLTWREILQRVLEDKLQVNYPAHLKENELEKLVLDSYGSKRKSDGSKGSLNIPAGGLGKVGKLPGLVLAIINDVGKMMDDLLGSSDQPAVAVVISICYFLQNPE